MKDLIKLTDEQLSAVLQERKDAHMKAFKPYSEAKKLHEEAMLELHSRATGIRVGVRFMMRNSEWIVKESKVVNSVHIVLASKILKGGKVSDQLTQIHGWQMRKIHIVPNQ